MQRRALITTAGALPLLNTVLRPAYAAEPPLRVIVPYAAGGPTDAMARVLQPELSQRLGASLVIENVAGAGGSLGAQAAMRAESNGKTFFLGNNGPIAVTPLILGRKSGFDPEKDFTPVCLVARATMMLAISNAVPVDSLQGFIQYANAHPGELNFASAGVGSLGHLASEYFARQTGLKMTHVAYKGQTPTLTALLSNEVQMLLTTPNGAMRSYIDDKRIKLIAVTSDTPSPLYPHTALLRSAIPGFSLYSWFAFMARAGSPAPALQQMSHALQQILALPAIREKFENFGLTADWQDAAVVSRYIREDLQRWRPIIQEQDIQLS